MDQIDQCRPAARASAPPICIEIRLVLAHRPEALDRGEPADPPGFDRIPRDLDRGVEAAVMTDRERRAVRGGRSHDGAARFERVGDRLFHQHRQPALDARDADFRVTVVRGGDDRTVDRFPRQQIAVVAIETRAVALHERAHRIHRVRDRNDLAFGLLTRQLQMAHADAARTEQGQSNRIVHTRSPAKFSRAECTDAQDIAASS